MAHIRELVATTLIDPKSQFKLGIETHRYEPNNKGPGTWRITYEPHCCDRMVVVLDRLWWNYTDSIPVIDDKKRPTPMIVDAGKQTFGNRLASGLRSLLKPC
jgi:hypothetical protein